MIWVYLSIAYVVGFVVVGTIAAVDTLRAQARQELVKETDIDFAVFFGAGTFWPLIAVFLLPAVGIEKLIWACARIDKIPEVVERKQRELEKETGVA